MTTTTSTMTTIEIPLEDFARYNGSMLHLLQTLYVYGGSLFTTKLYAHAHKSNHYSLPWLRKAEAMGFITRKKIPMPKGKKGNARVINVLTPKGRKLLSSLGLT